MVASDVVSVLYTDIEGSTRLWEEHGGAVADMLAEHDRLLVGAVAEAGGRVLKHTGDGMIAVFETPAAAVSASCAAQRSLIDQNWDAVEPAVRMAVHTGPVFERDNDLFGPTLNRCSRILAAGNGGQILVSAATAASLGAGLPAGIRLTDLGPHRLRDLQDPEHLFCLQAPGLPVQHPPLRSLASFSHNLPLQLTSFVGRDIEIRQVEKHLTASRLLSLVGPGGSGKTRLALQVAAESLDRYGSGVWFIDLSRAGSGHSVADIVEATLGTGYGATEEGLVRALQGRSILLVLDNCEHVGEEAAQLGSALLAGCPDLQILATSRERLRLSGEFIFDVPAMSLPDAKAGAGVVLDSDAIRLFLERAELVGRPLELDERTIGFVGDICRRVDGIPLAIELAAARLRTLGLGEIAERLEDQLQLLVGGDPGGPDRHRTLRAAIEWSYRLLNPAQRALFDRLAVFAGGWDLEGAIGVCAGDPVETDAIPEMLDRLVELNLVIRAVTDDDRSRYRLLETLRQFAQDRLMATERSDEFRARHAGYFAGFSERAEQGLLTADDARWYRRLEADRPNLLAAIHRSLDTGVPLDALRILATGEILMLGLQPFDGLRVWIESALDRCPGAPPALRAGALNTAAESLVMERKAQMAEDYARRALDEAGPGPSRRRFHALHQLGWAAGIQGKDDLACRWLRRGLEEAEAADDIEGIINALSSLSSFLPDPREAQEYANRALELARREGPTAGLGSVLLGAGFAAEAQGQFGAAGSHLREASESFLSGHAWGPAVFSLVACVRLALSTGEYQEARRLLDNARQLMGEHPTLMGGSTSDLRLGAAAAEALTRTVMDDDGVPKALAELVGAARQTWSSGQMVDGLLAAASVARLRGDLDQAVTLAEEAYPIAEGLVVAHYLASVLAVQAAIALDSGDPVGALNRYGSALRRGEGITRLSWWHEHLAGLAAALAAVGRCEIASALLGYTAHQTRSVGIQLFPADRRRTQRATDECRLALGPAFEDVWNEAGLMTREVVVERAQAAIDR